MTATAWRKSRRSGNSGANCVEARVEKTNFQVRDSKLGDASPIFELDTEGFASLLRAAQR
jgi:hypothetical protein